MPAPQSTAAAIRDRAVGSLMGLAIGDAIGTTLEFTKRNSTPPVTDMVGGGPLYLAPGEWTDDTAMALALADSLLMCGKIDELDLMRRFARWWRDGAYSRSGECFDIGTRLRRLSRASNAPVTRLLDQYIPAWLVMAALCALHPCQSAIRMTRPASRTQLLDRAGLLTLRPKPSTPASLTPA